MAIHGPQVILDTVHHLGLCWKGDSRSGAIRDRGQAGGRIRVGAAVPRLSRQGT